MKYFTRRFVKPGDLNPANRLFGGQLLSWIDEEAAIFASCQMKRERIVTKYMSEINFMRSSRLGDVIEIGVELVEAGRSSLTVSCQVRNKNTHEVIITIAKIVFVAIDENGAPVAHGYERRIERPELMPESAVKGLTRLQLLRTPRAGLF